jgi:hypothetical protein
MRYEQGLYHGITWLEAFIRFRIVEPLQGLFGSKKVTETQQV